MSASDSQTSASGKDRVIQRGLWLDSALDEMRRDLEEDRFVSAIGHFREALAISQGLPQLKARVNEHAELHSDELLPRNWRIAEALLQEAAATEPPLSPDPELLEKVKQARHEERVAMALHKADRLALDGKPAEARDALAELLHAHPNDTQIKDRLQALDPPVPVEALPDVQPEPDPLPEPVPEKETPSPVPVPPWPTKVLISSSAWNTTKDLAAVVATAAMLGLAGLLVWRHYAEPPARPIPRYSPKQEQATPPPAPAASKSIFEDVPPPPSDQDVILQAVRAFSQESGKKIDNAVVDEVDIQGKQAKVRFRPKDKSSGPTLVFSLIRQNDTWKVQKVQ
jgi:hypothetical protein